VPSLVKAGRSLPSASAVTPGRANSSVSKSFSSFFTLMVTGTISSVKRPDLMAASALFWEPAANASCCSRVSCHLAATFSAVLPMW